MKKEDIKKEIKRQATLELARRDLFTFCQVMSPAFYVKKAKKSNHLKIMCDEMQDFVFNDTQHDVLIINMGPRHGKTYTLKHLIKFYLGKNPQGHVMMATYNHELSVIAAKEIRDSIQEEKMEGSGIVYQEIFPGIGIKKGDGAAHHWSLNVPGAYSSFLSTSPTSSATGFPASLICVDDLIKNHFEAWNPKHCEKLYNFINNTLGSRLEQKEDGTRGKMIIIATRWSSEDPSGKILEDPAFKGRVRTLTMKTLLNEETHEMLCPELLNYENYLRVIAPMDKRIAAANYQQVCIDNDSLLFNNLKEYDVEEFNKKDSENHFARYMYIDTADTGEDYECAISFALDWKEHKIYIIDVLYTQKSMEITEEEIAKILKDKKIQLARFEQNNGGRGHARAIQRLTQEKYNNYYTQIKYFHQSGNKESRIRGNSTTVNGFIYFPKNWNILWPEFFVDLKKFDPAISIHDDAPDAITGVIETATKIGFFNN